MELIELNTELGSLLGTMLADRSFDRGQRVDAINWACDQLCTRLGLTIKESTMTVVAGDVVLPDGLVKVVRVMSST